GLQSWHGEAKAIPGSHQLRRDQPLLSAEIVRLRFPAIATTSESRPRVCHCCRPPSAVCPRRPWPVRRCRADQVGRPLTGALRERRKKGVRNSRRHRLHQPSLTLHIPLSFSPLRFPQRFVSLCSCWVAPFPICRSSSAAVFFTAGQNYRLHLICA